jgi:arylsulfatase A
MVRRPEIGLEFQTTTVSNYPGLAEAVRNRLPVMPQAMKKMNLSLSVRLGWLTLLVLAFTPGARAAVSPPPNIVIILSDDLGYGSVSCYGADPKLVRTPNIDRLAREGRRFTDGNTTSSVCSPTRYSLLTGRYCWRTSLSNEVLNVFAPLHIETNRLNLASLLRRHGYHTAAVGKWHLGYGTAERTDYNGLLAPGPLELGFEYHFGVPSNHGDVTGVFVENHFVYGLRSGKIPSGLKIPAPVADDDNYAPTYKPFAGGRPSTPIDAPRRVDDRVMPVLTDKAVAWLEQQKSGTPFFLYYTPVAVHNPVTPSAKTRGSSSAGPYGDWIHELDVSVGRVLDTLDKLKLADNTLVIFTSDNGGSGQMSEIQTMRVPNEQVIAMKAGLDLNKPWRGRKHSVYQGGFRVPFIVRWPGHVPVGTTCDETISVVDMLATISALMGDQLPPATQAAEDSYNVLPAFVGQNYTAPLRPFLIVHSADGVFGIRQGPWKWIEGVSSKTQPPKIRSEEFKPQLYNLQDDPKESKDVLPQHPEVAKRLAALLGGYRSSGHSR